jgi:hypothetical protein
MGFNRKLGGHKAIPAALGRRWAEKEKLTKQTQFPESRATG